MVIFDYLRLAENKDVPWLLLRLISLGDHI